MSLPFLDKNKKKEQQKAKKTKQIITMVLFVAAIGIFAAIFFKLDKEHLSVDQILNPNAHVNQVQEPLPIRPAPMGPDFAACTYEHWIPYFFKEKLVYCDHNYQTHVKTNLDADKVVAADRFSDGMARILVKTSEVDTAYLYIDKNGKEAIPVKPDRDYCGPFSEGLACAEDRGTGKLGFVDKTGKYVIQPVHDVSVFVSGNVVHKQDQLDNSIFSCGLAPVYNAKVNSAGSKAACGYIDHKGKFVIPVGFLQGCPFVNQRARVCVKDDSKWQKRWGYIDMKGKFVLKPVYMEILDFKEGLAAVLDYKGQWGFIDKNGNYSIPSQFAGASSFSENIAAVSMAQGKDYPNWGYIKKDGSWLVEPKFDRAEPFQDGIAFACNGCEDKRKRPKEEFIVNLSGKVEKRSVPQHLDLKLPDAALKTGEH